MPPTILIPNTTQAVVRQEGREILLIVNGRAVLQMPWDAALVLSRAIYTQAKKAEELANADLLIADNALLMRAGIPLDLTTRPELLNESRKEAAWNSSLRRYIRASRYDQRHAGRVYAPSVKQMKAREHGDLS